MKILFCIVQTIKPLKTIWDSDVASKILKNGTKKKFFFFYSQDCFHPKIIHGLSQEANPIERMFTLHHVSHVTRQVSCVGCRMSCVIFLFLIYSGQMGGASRWRVCYQQGLPRLVSLHITFKCGIATAGEPIPWNRKG